MGDDERMDDLDGEGGAPEGGGGSSDVSKIIKILIWVVAAIIGFFMVVGISFLVAKYVQERSYQAQQDIVVAPPPPALATFDLSEFAATTSDPEPHFVKIKISLGYEDSVELQTELVRRRVQIRHLVNILLRGKKYQDLNSIEDTIALAEEIKAQINVILISGKIREVYFDEFIVN